MKSINPFIEGWSFLETLGEGAYGEVKLAANSKQDLIAVKVINIGSIVTSLPSCEHSEMEQFIKKEIVIHKALKCKNIIKFYGMRRETERIYIFLEYVSGGELFDRIEPDIGVPRPQARFYFTQLLNGVNYIHSKGITHRDIKPENILFDSLDTLKICDFGLSTMFRFQGKERKLTRRCGTICYVAPEVLYLPYSAQPAELWSCGIVLFTLLLGHLPWVEPTVNDSNFTDWTQGNLMNTHILNRLTKNEVSLFGGILSIDPKNRLKLEEILQHEWFKENIPNSNNLYNSAKIDNFLTTYSSIPCTQPVTFSIDSNPDFSIQRDVFLSQPSHIDEVYLGTQFATQTSSCTQHPTSGFITKRLTRIFFNSGIHSTIDSLTSILSSLRMKSRLTSDHSSASVRVVTIDLKGQPLKFTLLLYCFSEFVTMVDFRRTRGDAIEFKRKFKLIENMIKTSLPDT